MSEPLLKAILQLFAFLARIDGVSDKERTRLRRMLSRRLTRADVEIYMQVFERYVGYSGSDQPGEYGRQQTLPVLCDRINRELTLQQKTVLLLELLQILFADGLLSKRENLAVRQIAHELKVTEDLEALILLVTADDILALNHPGILIISGRKKSPGTTCIFRFQPGMEGSVAVLLLKSANTFFLRGFGTSTLYMNQVPLEPGAIEILSPGSSLRGELFKTLYYSDVLSYFSERRGEIAIGLRTTDLEYRFNDGAYALRGVSLSESGGRLFGIMGTSGSGKTTLLRLLSGSIRPSRGLVVLNGLDVHQNSSQIAGLMGYVPQDDLLIEELTAFENLRFAAELYLSGHEPSQLDLLAMRVLANLGLEDVADRKVGNLLSPTLSGGQRKRLNIGLELLREPQVLFVDEPTSGLSSRDSENIMDLLKELALRGKLIVTVLHQPSSEIFKLLDSLLILDIGGLPVYYGNPVEAVVYFKEAANLLDRRAGACSECGNVNPEQIFAIIEARIVDEYGRITAQRKVSPQSWYDLHRQEQSVPAISSQTEAIPSRLSPPGPFRQFMAYLRRDLRSKWNRHQYILINLLEAPLIALALAVLLRYYQSDVFAGGEYIFQENLNLPVYLFMAVIVALFMGLVVSAEEIIRDRKILQRERALHLSRMSYLTAKISVLFFISAIQTLSLVLVANAVLEIKGMALSHWMVLFSASCCANVLGLNISSAFDSPVIVYILIPLLLIPQIVLGGAVVDFDKLNPSFRKSNRVPLVGDLMSSRWAFEALMVTQYKDNRFQRMFYDLERAEFQSDFKASFYLPRLQSMLDFTFKNQDGPKREMSSNYMRILAVETAGELVRVGEDKYTELSALSSGRLDSAQYEATGLFLDNLRRMYLMRNRSARRERESIVARMTDSPARAREYRYLQKSYTNDQISTYVLQKREINRLTEYPDRIEQNVYAALRDPEPRYFLDYRAHFYAPRKYFAGFYIDTLIFNTAVLWAHTIVLYMLLYWDALRKGINLCSSRLLYDRRVKQNL